MKTNPHDPSSPFDWRDFQPNTGAQIVREQFIGLTKREHFAMAALQGLLANSHDQIQGLNHQETARVACDAADALIAELNKTAQ